MIKKGIASLAVFLKDPSLYNKENKVKQLKIRIKTILERERVDEIKREYLERDVDHNFSMIKELVVFFLFLIIYSYASISQLDIEDSFALNNISRLTLYAPYFNSSGNLTLSDVISMENVYDYIQQVLVNQLEETSFSNTYLYLGNTIRVTIQMNSIIENNDRFSKDVIPTILRSDYNFTSFRGKSTKTLYSTYPPGNLNSFNRNGGVVFTVTHYYQGVKLVDILREDDILNSKCDYIAIEWATYNGNLDTFTYNSLKFDQLQTGLVEPIFYSGNINSEFHGNWNITNFILLIISSILSFYFVGINIGEIRLKYKKADNKRKENEKLKSIIKNTIADVCKGDEVKQISFSERWFKACARVFLHCISIFIQLITVIYAYFTKKISGMIEIVSLVLIYVTIFKGFAYRINPFSLNSIDDFAQASQNLDNYFTIIAFNFFFLYIRIPKYFLLSPRLSFLINVLRKSKIDILFFLLMYSIILFGFAIAGYILLGHSHW